MTCPTSVSIGKPKSGQFLFYNHLQILVPAVHKHGSVESFSAFAMLKQWPTQEHVFKFHSLNAEQGMLDQGLKVKKLNNFFEF